MVTRCESTLRLAQSTTAVRYTKPRAIGMYVVSSAHAWLARSIFTPRSQYGQILCWALRRLLFGLQYSASTPMRFISVRARATAADLVPLATQQSRQHPRPGKRNLWSVRRSDASVSD
ncbi:hypothetical protein BGV66_07340 [Burkholderia ubonensis]|uniref:Uncharacterized protein n=1 Tax=Burkholderia ubonensis TaxID=101571 RepID=A0ABD6Q7T4_9BURK|nr:hypothetical protein BGV66_07340 [Burkholderia ubonensis]